jgi:hypothetical protein
MDYRDILQENFAAGWRNEAVNVVLLEHFFGPLRSITKRSLEWNSEGADCPRFYLRYRSPVIGYVQRIVGAATVPLHFNINPCSLYEDGIVGLSLDGKERENGNNYVTKRDEADYDLAIRHHKWLNLCCGILLMVLSYVCVWLAGGMYFDNGRLTSICWLVVGFPLWIVGMGVLLHAQ